MTTEANNLAALLATTADDLDVRAAAARRDEDAEPSGARRSALLRRRREALGRAAGAVRTAARDLITAEAFEAEAAKEATS